VGGALSHIEVPLEVQGAHSEPVKGIVLYEYCVGPVHYTLYLDVLGRVRPRFKEPPGIQVSAREAVTGKQ
jgi:hypothetical protein